MTLEEFKQGYRGSELTGKILFRLGEVCPKVKLNGLAGSSGAIVAHSVADQSGKDQVFILSDKEEAAYFLNDLQQLEVKVGRILFFPHSYKLPYQLEEIDNASVVSRAGVLDRIHKNQQAIIVTYPLALSEKIVSRKTFAKNILEVRRGGNYSRDFIDELLLSFGFDKVDFVYSPGQFALRGGIIDVFSYSNEYPYRIEFFGDDVESIRTFDPVNQLSVQELAFFSIVPDVQRHTDESRTSLLSFLKPDSVIWARSFDVIVAVLESEMEKAGSAYDKLEETPVAHAKPEELYLSGEEFSGTLKSFASVEFGEYVSSGPDVIHCGFSPQPSFNKNFDLLIADLKKNHEAGFQNIILSNQAKQLERLYAIFEDIGSDAIFSTLPLTFHEGFIDRTEKLACYTDHQIFERYHRYRLKEGFLKNQQALTLKEIYNLQKGDFVTHVDHGIGRFSGLEAIDVNGKKQEAVRLVYKDNDVLYVSVHTLHKISKYTGKDGTVPTLHKIGSQTWSNLKQRAKSKVKELAFDLIQLYAKRKQEPGFAFAPDSYLMNELEASFMYEETPDQLKAVIAVKEDMEKTSPMDRLVCGDVGFGKTEIAIRAAFKAACDNKQVAVLVPTTILSYQHYHTFSERLKGFPCNVDFVNRFRTQKQITQSLKKLKDGETDIIIGTHKLVGKNVEFKNLGLIIVDEEQKFGVGVKDKLKLFRASVDTLTLTATPIPRTLRFSLMGARDLSVITTPPANRQPVDTEIMTMNQEVIRDAVSREVDRGGQVFFVHNRIQNIHEVAGMISRLCPGVRISIGHGQMDGAKLERVMVDFMNGEHDVLVSTAIVESGIDVPNANTMIINNAHEFGLSDLHQLRGRVGRSNRKAYCYLITPPVQHLASDSRKRLEAIAHFSDLGSGFNIAMRDLDIRGAGNLLGGEQSGFIAEVGFEMYHKILAEAVKELRENEFKHLFVEENARNEKIFVDECALETDLELRIPEDYVNNVTERLIIYQDLDNSKSEDSLAVFERGMVDRFGPLPSSFSELISAVRLRWIARDIGVERLVLKSGKMLCYFVADPKSSFYASPEFTSILEYIRTNPPGVKLEERNGRLRLIVERISGVAVAIAKLSEIGRLIT